MNRNEVDDLTVELNDQIEQLPQIIARSERELKTSTAKLEKLLAMQNSVERVAQLKMNLLPKIRDEIKKIETDLSAFQEKVRQSERSVEEPREKKEIVSRMVGDMSLLDEAIRDVEQARTELMPLKQSLPPSDGTNDTNLESLQKKRKELTDKIKKLEKDINILEKRIQEDNKQIMTMQNRIIDMEKEELRLQGDFQKFDSLKTREKELTEQVKELKQKKTAIDQALIPIEGKIKNAEEKRRRTKANGAEKYTVATKRFEGLKKNFDNIERVSKELEKLALLNLERELERCGQLQQEAEDDKTKQVTNIQKYLSQLTFWTYFLNLFFVIYRQQKSNRFATMVKHS